ncbi:hypothetical protein [Acinetobacter tianfuensis]|uniref:hypothetical protein n=1 Tax=Acinetobacter tianfuensis TaxID=2419603 RepID=UPI001D17EB04|nr:hypothetical protein [Acinetobacter tianfuensis]
MSPTFYVTEIVKVLVVLSIFITIIGALLDVYNYLYKKYRKFQPKRKLRFNSFNEQEPLKQQFEKAAKRYVWGQSVFVISIYITCMTILFSYQVVGLTTYLWSSVLIGITLSIFTNADLRKDKQLKYVAMMILIVFSTCFSAQLKLNHIENSPQAILKHKDQKTWYVLDAFQDKLVLFSQTEKQSDIKVVKFEEVERIRSEK